MAAVTALGAASVSACFTPAGLISLCGALVALVVLPGWATAYALVGGDSQADRADALAASFGGIAVSATALWIAGATIGLSRSSILAAPICAALVLVATGPREPAARRSFPPRFTALLLLAATFALLVAIPFYPYGRTRADGIHVMGLSDWYLHLMMTSTLDTAGSLPPTNPYLLAHKGARYHYAFHLLAAAIHRAAGRPVDVFPILLGLTLLTAAAYPLVLFSVSRRRLGGDAAKAFAAAAGGVFLAGFDLMVWSADIVHTLVAKWPLPPGIGGLRLLIPSVHLHSWIPVFERQFNAPYLALLWAPHYVAAVLVSLLCLHGLRNEIDRPPVFVAAFLLASLPGLSAYVLLATAVAVGALVLADQWHHGWPLWRSPATVRWVRTGATALVLAAPILLTLRASVEQHVAPLILHVSSVGTLRNGALFTFLLGDHQWTRVLDTPALLLFQFGIVGVLGALSLVRRMRDGAMGRSRARARGRGPRRARVPRRLPAANRHG